MQPCAADCGSCRIVLHSAQHRSISARPASVALTEQHQSTSPASAEVYQLTELPAATLLFYYYEGLAGD
jgi:hypothetical protein